MAFWFVFAWSLMGLGWWGCVYVSIYTYVFALTNGQFFLHIFDERGEQNGWDGKSSYRETYILGNANVSI